MLPGIYVAMATFHQQMLPLPLLRSIIESKAQVPFSTAVEVLGLLIAFELLQESGVHLPQSVGHSVSIIGGIVLEARGQRRDISVKTQLRAARKTLGEAQLTLGGEASNG